MKIGSRSPSTKFARATYKVLQMCNGNRLRAAQILGIGRTSLYRYLKRDGYEGQSRALTSGAAA
jgi:transcriptional regulator of acetoin/glycerol metabolism